MTDRTGYRFQPGRFIHRRHRLICLAALVLTLLAFVGIARLDLNVDLFALLPEKNAAVDRVMAISRAVGIQSLLVAVVHVSPVVTDTRARNLVDQVAQRLAALNTVSEVRFRHRPQDRLALLHNLLTHLPLLLDKPGLEQLAERLSNTGIAAQIHQNRQLMMTPLGVGVREYMLQDPLGLSDIFLSGVQVPPDPAGFSSSHGYYRDRGGHTYFLFVTPVSPPQDMAFSRQLMKAVEQVGGAVVLEWAQGHGYDADSARLAFTGAYPIAVRDEALTRFDIKITLLTSIAAILLLFYLAFRTIRLLFYVTCPLAVSLVWTVGFAGFVYQQVNILSFIFSCVLVGLGIDFAIHMVNRFFDPDGAGQSLAQQLDRTFADIGGGLMVGGATTAAAFFAVAASDFRGFRELGIITGSGIVFCLAAMVFLLPALLIFFPLKRRPPQPSAAAGAALDALLRFVGKKPRAVVAAAAVILVILAPLSTRIRFDDNLRHLRPTDHHVLALQDQVSRWMGRSAGAVLLVFDAKNEAEGLARNAQILRALRPLENDGRLAAIRSISRFLPPPAAQADRIAYLKDHAASFDMDRIAKAFAASLHANGFQMLAAHKRYLDRLALALTAAHPLMPSHLSAAPLLAPLVRQFAFPVESGFTFVTYLYPEKDLWSRADTLTFKNSIDQALSRAGIGPDGYELTGTHMLTAQLKNRILLNLKSALVLAALVVSAFLMSYFRSWRWFLMSILPLLAGLTTLLAIMVLCRTAFNFLSLMVLPMILGIGIDDGVHFVNTLRRGPPENRHSRQQRTARAIVLTSLTTVCGFGSLTLSHYPGLQSMGLVAVVGILACMIFSITLLPAIGAGFSRVKKAADR